MIVLPSKYKLDCPYCVQPIEVAAGDLGQWTSCPHCGEEIPLELPRHDSMAINASPPPAAPQGTNTVHVQHHYPRSVPTRGDDTARAVKIISALAMVVGVILFPVSASLEFPFIGHVGIILLGLGFFGFVVGRFME